MCFGVFCMFWDRSDQGLSGKLFQLQNYQWVVRYLGSKVGELWTEAGG